ncbi:MAG: hypothetical protein NTU76_02410 [Candidatus Taylorbacteria bacterium]|nr:hypothetical protein [Candidatus Taylorbacteria bacterium]
MTQLNSSWRVFGRPKVLDKGYALKLFVNFDPELIAHAISELPDSLKVICTAHLARYLKKENPIEIFIYKFSPKIANPQWYILRRNLALGDIIDLLLISSQIDILKGRVVIAPADTFVKSPLRISPDFLPAIDFRGGKVTFFLMPKTFKGIKRACYLATRM